MSALQKEIIEKAMALTPAEREKLASSLFQTTHNSELTENDREWMAVAEERFDDLQSGRDLGIAESEFFGKVKESVRWK